MFATIASSLADLFCHPSVRGNIYLQDLKAWPDIMIITVFLIHSSFVATNGSFGLIQSHLCLDYKNLLTLEEGFSKTMARETPRTTKMRSRSNTGPARQGRAALSSHRTKTT